MIKFPFTSFQQFNLDWIMQQLHKILDFMPQNGVAGDVLQRTADGAVWQPIPAISLDIHALNPMTDHVAGNDELAIYDNSLQGNYKISVYDLMDLAPVQSVNGMTGDILLDIPAVPVDSVNGQTGDVILSAADVGALPDTTVIPDSTSDLINDSGYVDAAGAAAAAPVQSVNGQTGAVTVQDSDLYFGNSLQTLTVTIDTLLDAGNDCTIADQLARLAVSNDQKTIRLCGMLEITPSTTAGWRTFVLTGATIVDLTDAYVHCDYTCDMYEKKTPADAIFIASSGSYVNYRVMADKTIRLYVYIGSSMISAGNNLLIHFNGIPIQITP